MSSTQVNTLTPKITVPARRTKILARSAIATSVLQKLGVGGAVDLRGGFAAWQEAGYEVVRDAVPLEV